MKQIIIKLKNVLLLLGIGIPSCLLISELMNVGTGETMIIFFSILIGGYISSQKNMTKRNKIIVIVGLLCLGELFLEIEGKSRNIMMLYFFIWLGNFFCSTLFSKK